jgi:hypothetical protein
MNAGTDRHRLLSSRALSVTAKLFHNVKDAIIMVPSNNAYRDESPNLNAIILHKICLGSTWVLLLI